MLKEQFYEDMDNYFDIVRFNTYKKECRNDFELSKKMGKGPAALDFYKKQNYERALSYVTDYICCEIFDNNVYRYDFFLKKHKILRDVTYISKCIDKTYKYFNTLSSFKTFTKKERAIIVLMAINPVYFVFSDQLIYKAKEYLNINICDKDIYHLFKDGAIYFTPKEYKEERNKEKIEKYQSRDLYEGEKPMSERKVFPSLIVMEKEKGIWSIDGCREFSNIATAKNEFDEKPRKKPDCLGLFKR